MCELGKIIALIKKLGGGSGSSVQSDWNQNDSTAADYVKNRPFYTGEPVETVFVESQDVAFSDVGSGVMAAQFPSALDVSDGDAVTVVWDGVTYETSCVLFNSNPVIGNLGIVGAGEDTQEPFLFINEGPWTTVTNSTEASHNIKISGVKAPIMTMPKKYLPDEVTKKVITITKNIEEWTAEEKEAYYAAFKNNQVLYYAASGPSGSAIRGLVLAIWYMSIVGVKMAIITDDCIVAKFNSDGGWSSLRFGNSELTIGKEIADIDASNGAVQQAKLTFEHGSIRYTSSIGGGTDGPYTSVTKYLVCDGDASIILQSSTASSTKKFKITVDDTGTISATEVT